MGTVQSKIVKPPAALERYVESFRLSTQTIQGDVAIRVCPNTYPGLVFQHHDRQSAIQDIVVSSGRVVRVPTLFIHGQVTALSVMHFSAPYATIQVILKPHALGPLFDIDAAMMTNNSIASDAFGGETLGWHLLDTNDADEQVALLGDFLVGKLAANGQSDTLIEDILAYIDRNIGTITVEKVHTAFGISERQLQRRFKQNVGIAPQLYIRIRRINEAFRLMDSGNFNRLSDIAYELNFHDQSHFIRDIKAFSGITPKDISQKINDFHHDQVGSSYIYR